MNPLLCADYFVDQLQPSNCIGILRFGRHYFCKDLEERGRLYVRHNFEQVLKESKEFEDLNVVDLKDILSDDELNVKTEEVVFQALQKWLNIDVENRKMYLLDLLKCVRLGPLSETYIKTMINWAPVHNNEVNNVYCFF